MVGVLCKCDLCVCVHFSARSVLATQYIDNEMNGQCTTLDLQQTNNGTIANRIEILMT